MAEKMSEAEFKRMDSAAIRNPVGTDAERLWCEAARARAREERLEKALRELLDDVKQAAIPAPSDLLRIEKALEET